jgi:hypothetical protein
MLFLFRNFTKINISIRPHNFTKKYSAIKITPLLVDIFRNGSFLFVINEEKKK